MTSSTQDGAAGSAKPESPCTGTYVLRFYIFDAGPAGRETCWKFEEKETENTQAASAAAGRRAGYIFMFRLLSLQLYGRIVIFSCIIISIVQVCSVLVSTKLARITNHLHF